MAWTAGSIKPNVLARMYGTYTLRVGLRQVGGRGVGVGPCRGVLNLSARSASAVDGRGLNTAGDGVLGVHGQRRGEENGGGTHLGGCFGNVLVD